MDSDRELGQCFEPDWNVEDAGGDFGQPTNKLHCSHPAI